MINNSNLKSKFCLTEEFAVALQSWFVELNLILYLSHQIREGQ